MCWLCEILGTDETDYGVRADLQLERLSSPMFCFFRMECRRWAPTCSVAGFFLLFWLSLVTCMDCWVDGMGLTAWIL